MGGGVIVFGGDGDVTLDDCTLSGNSAGSAGGGIEAQGTVSVISCTLAGNDAASYGGAIDNSRDAYEVNVEDSIFSGGTASIQGPEISNSVISAGNNLVDETDGSTGWVASDLTGTVSMPLNALLAPLGSYGGPTQTMPLLPGSPAIGKGVAVAGVITDQPACR